MAWTIRQISKMTGISNDSLRFYEKLGILSPQRKENGYRYYDESDYRTLQYIAVMKYAHFSLADIGVIVQSLHAEPSEECSRKANEIFLKKHKELTDMAENYLRIVKLIDILLPMLRNSKAFSERGTNIDAFVGRLFDDIRQSDGA